MTNIEKALVALAVVFGSAYVVTERDVFILMLFAAVGIAAWVAPIDDKH